MRHFDDLRLGHILPVGSWKLEPDAVMAFAREWDPQPFHTDPTAAASSIFNRLTASSLHLFAICTRLFFDMEDPVAVMAMLGKDHVRFPHPAGASELLTYTTTVQELRPSRSKPDRGIVVLADRLCDSSGVEVMTQQVSLLVHRASP